MNKPTIVKEAATPPASATGPKRRSLDAAPKTTGRIGSTQGDSTVSTPAAKAAPKVRRFMGERPVGSPRFSRGWPSELQRLDRKRPRLRRGDSISARCNWAGRLGEYAGERSA